MNKFMVSALLCATTLVSAQELQKAEQLDSVFIDTKVQLPRKNSGKVVTKITSETLERSAGKSVAQVINEVSGIEINGSRSFDGQNLGYYVRGGRNRQVVIMLDGVQVTDGSQIANDYDLRLIPAQNIQQIEIVKGASSVLYGSGAATAVINITTKKSSDKPIAATFTSTVGTNQAQGVDDYRAEEFTNSVNANGTLGKFFYLVTFNNRYVDGLSAIAAPEGEELFESDVFDSFDTKVNFGIHLTENIKMSQFFSYGKFKTGFDNFDFTDANHLSETRQLRTGGNFEWKYKNGTYVFNDSYAWIEREIQSGFPTKFDSRFYALDNYVQHRFGERFTAIAGFNLSTSNMNAFSIPFGESRFAQVINQEDARFTIFDPYVNVVYVSDFGLNLNAGARLNTHSVYDNKLVYNINPSYNFALSENNLKILASYSTAYITPSLFQIYDPSFGNEDLVPEENATIEAGVEFTTNTNFRVSVVYFTRNEKNFVDFVIVDPINFFAQYQNIADEFTADGVEVELAKRFNSQWNVMANYTFTQPDERFALRIPKHKVNASVGYMPTERTTFSLSYQYNSSREDRFFSMETFEQESVTLDEYGILDFYVSQRLTKNIRLFAGLNNLLDETYEELFRYSTRGRNVRLGFSLEF
ncbi:MAG: TonB-dependent receptor [Flavobacteriales bacterium]|nr:TonB-dependent receptor [Flavobacteriales bacterium]